MLSQMRFSDRTQAGQLLAEALIEHRMAPPAEGVEILGIPRGGVVVAREVAAALRAPLGVLVVRKLGAPGEPELGVGAIAPGVVVLDEAMLGALKVTPHQLESEIEAQEDELARRAALYGGYADSLADTVAVIVDDGIATGGTAVAAVRWCRQAGASRVIVAAPVVAPRALEHLRGEADDVVVLTSPDGFRAVGTFYGDFTQVTDDEVVAILGQR